MTLFKAILAAVGIHILKNVVYRLVAPMLFIVVMVWLL